MEVVKIKSLRDVFDKVTTPEVRYDFCPQKYPIAEHRRVQRLFSEHEERLKELLQHAEDLIPDYQKLGLNPIQVFLAGARKRRKENDFLGQIKCLTRASEYAQCCPESIPQGLINKLEEKKAKLLAQKNVRLRDDFHIPLHRVVEKNNAEAV